MNVCLKQSHLWFCSIFRSFGNPTAAAYLGGKSSIYFDVSQRTKPPARTASGISMISHVGWLEGNSWYPLVISRSYGKSPFLMGKSTISMAIFNSYVWHNQRVRDFTFGESLKPYPKNPQDWSNRIVHWLKITSTHEFVNAVTDHVGSKLGGF